MGDGDSEPVAGRPARSRRPASPAGHELAELVSRVVERGVVITGDVVISVAGVDLIYLGLDVVLAATDQLPSSAAGEGRSDAPGHRETTEGPGAEADGGSHG